MNNPKWICLLFIAFISPFVFAKEPMPTEKKDGLYSQKLGSGGSVLFYIVDTQAQLCFASPGGGAALTNIDCEKLKQREVWKEIITW